MRFKREISSFGILCASLGGIMGSGWLFGSLFAAQLAGPAALISWIIGGISIMFLAITFAEITCMFPISGGVAAFPVFTHGKLVGFVLTWITWITYVVSVSQEVQSTVLYMGNKFPSWVQKVDGVVQFTHLGLFIAFFIMFSLILVNSFGAKLFSRANSFISVWKFIVPVVVVIMFLFTDRHADNHIFSQAHTFHTFAPYGLSGIFSAVVLAGIVYSFCGFQHGAMLAGEAKNPQKAVPIALIGSITLCILIYCALQYSFIKVLPPESVLQGWKNLSFEGDAGPLAGLATLLGLSWLGAVLYVDSIVSPLGTGALYVASGARIVQNMGTSGSAPKFFAYLTKSGTPLRALLINFVFAMMAFLPFKGWQAIVSFLSSALIFSYIVGPLCLVALRRQIPDHKRPFRLPFYQVFSFIAFFVCNQIIFWSGFDVVWKLSVTIIVGILVFVFSNVFKTHQARIADYKAAIWLFPYMSGLTIISYFSSFTGGINKIPMGIDSLCVFILSLVIFIMSQKFSLTPTETNENINAIMKNQSLFKKKEEVKKVEEVKDKSNIGTYHFNEKLKEPLP